MHQASTTTQDTPGIDFCPINGERVSSLEANKAILAAAVGHDESGLGRAIESERDWRRRYPEHWLGLTERALESPESALAVAQRGLESTYAHVSMNRNGETVPVREAMASFDQPRFFTGCVRGSARQPAQLVVPYRDGLLSGGELRRQLDLWVARDVLEPSARDAICEVLDHPQWLDLSDLHVALLGAGAQVGPLEPLLRYGANVHAVDVPEPHVWRRILAVARAGSGVLRFPMSRAQAQRTSDEELSELAGADLLVDAPEIRSWLLEGDEPLVVGGYAYLDGRKFVRVAVAMDAIMADLVSRRPNTALSYLLTPTDTYAVPMDAAERSAERFARGRFTKLMGKALRAATIGKACLPNLRRTVTSYAGEWGLMDNLLVQQGPNYALAKRLQRWRAILARHDGARVSCNVAPATATGSVTRNRLFRAGYEGSAHFGVEIFSPETTNTLMAALLIFDLRSRRSLSEPAMQLRNPQELFMQGASHGGFWRMAYQLRSVLHLGVLLGMLPKRRR